MHDVGYLSDSTAALLLGLHLLLLFGSDFAVADWDEGEPRLFFGRWHIFLFILVGDLEDVFHQLLDTDVFLRTSFEVAYFELIR